MGSKCVGANEDELNLLVGQGAYHVFVIYGQHRALGLRMHFLWSTARQEIYVLLGCHAYSHRFAGLSFEGYLPNKAVKLIREWCLVHQEELMKNWERAQQFEPLERVPGADQDD